MDDAVVIVPTTGAETLAKAIDSLANQSYVNLTALVVIDGEKYFRKTQRLLSSCSKNLNKKVIKLLDNVGANGFYGHRIYAAFSHLVNQDYVFFLDQDNWFEPSHVESMINNIKNKNLDWGYSLRNIVDKEGSFICQDNCESLGKYKSWTEYFHIDTNCYCLKNNVATFIAGAWHGGWGQDRVVFQTLKNYFPNYDTTGLYTTNYRLDGNIGSVSKDFFLQGNIKMMENYSNNFPWRNL